MALSAVMPPAAWHAALAGLCASLVGIGLARFAYTPLLPALVAHGWFDAAQAAYLGAGNLAGYLAGALLAPRLAAAMPPAPLLRAMMALATAAFFACALPLGFAWYLVWRFAAGVAGGLLMVLAATTVLSQVPPTRRGLAGGAIFTGVGLGIAASGTLVPLLLRGGLELAWTGLGLLALLLTALAWRGWPAAVPTPRAPRRPAAAPALPALCVVYGLNAVALVPHMLFLADFVARGLALGLAAAAWHWVLFGLGAVAGPLLAGAAADRVGFRAALRLALAVQAAAVPLVWAGPLGLALSSLVVGAAVPGIVPLVLGRVQEVTTPGDRPAAWGRATVGFALGQAGAAYGFAWLFTVAGYAPLFQLAVAALLLALVLEVAADFGTGRRGRPFHRQDRAIPDGRRGRSDVHSIFYIIGVIVVVLAILSFIGLA